MQTKEFTVEEWRKKLEEWRKWGKAEYKSTTNMMCRNSHHPDYNTEEKRQAIHDRFGNSWTISSENIDKVRTKYHYTGEMITEAVQAYKDGYNASRKWYEKADAKMQAIIKEWRPVLNEAEEIAKKVDVSDIKDGFPCGYAHLYVGDYPEMRELRKALAHFSNRETPPYKYRVPIKMPSYGQCITFDERICQAVSEFLRSKGLFTHIHSWID